MISTVHQTIFVHIPKCAGQSIEETFLKDIDEDLFYEHHRHLVNCFARPHGWPDSFPGRIAHLTAAQYRDLDFVSSSLWLKYYKFSIVRDPIDRCVSMWRYAKTEESFECFVSETLPRKIQARDFFYKSQREYLCDDEGNVLVNDIFHIRDLAGAWGRVQEAVGVQRELVRRNVSSKERPRLTDDMRIAIRQLYEDDFALLGRLFPGHRET